MNRNRELTVEFVEKWRKELPLSDISASIRSLYLLFDELRGTQLSAQKRFEILCAVRPTMSFLTHSLEKFYSTQEVLNEQQALISELSDGLYQEMYEGFKTVVNETGPSIFKRKLLLYALQNAMHYCSSMLIHAYQQHRQPSPGLWFELHSMYLLAQSKYLLSIPLPKVPEWLYQLRNLDNIYKHCLLFVLSSPFRLRRNQIEYLIYALESWAPLLDFSKTDADALYIVDYESDAPPQYVSLSFHPSGKYNYLQLEKVNRRLFKLASFRKSIQNGKENKVFTEAEIKLALPFVDFLLNSWQQVTQRSTTRHKTHDTVNVSITLSSIHWFISHPNANNEKDATHSQSSPKLYPAEVTDESEGGYCLKWSKTIPFSLQNGEVIGIVSETKNKKKTWEVGTIRWLKQEKDNSVYLGIQILSPYAIAVTTKLAESDNSPAIPTLLLPSENNRPTTLITPLLPFKPAQEVEIHYDNKDYVATLQRVRANSPSYQEFEIDFTSEPLTLPSDPMS